MGEASAVGVVAAGTEFDAVAGGVVVSAGLLPRDGTGLGSGAGGGQSPGVVGVYGGFRLAAVGEKGEYSAIADYARHGRIRHGSYLGHG